MKKRLLAIAFVFALMSYVICCGAEVETTEIQYSGEYHDLDNEYTTLRIDESNGYFSVVLSIHRLIQLEFTATQYDAILKGEERFDEEAVIGVEMMWDADMLKVIISNSTWDLLQEGTEYHFVLDQTDSFDGVMVSE